MTPLGDRQDFEALIQGKLSRQSLTVNLKELECGGLLQRMHNHGVQAPRLLPPALHHEVQALTAALSLFLQPSQSLRHHALVVVICDSWVLGQLAQGEELENPLRIPGVLWFLTDVWNQRVHEDCHSLKLAPF